MTKIVLENIMVKYPEKKIEYKHKIELTDSNYLIRGKNGEGKTTLLNVLTKSVGYEGNIKIDEKSLMQYSRAQISKKISYIKQNAIIFENLSIRENVKMFNLDLEKVTELLVYFKKEDKLDVPLKKLSGGEKQIVNIVLGMVKPSDILLIDEPLNNISVIQKKRVMNLIEKDKRFKIIISHTPLDIDVTTLVLKDGELIYE